MRGVGPRVRAREGDSEAGAPVKSAIRTEDSVGPLRIQDSHYENRVVDSLSNIFSLATNLTLRVLFPLLNFVFKKNDQSQERRVEPSAGSVRTAKQELELMTAESRRKALDPANIPRGFTASGGPGGRTITSTR